MPPLQLSDGIYKVGHLLYRRIIKKNAYRHSRQCKLPDVSVWAGIRKIKGNVDNKNNVFINLIVVLCTFVTSIVVIFTVPLPDMSRFLGGSYSGIARYRLLVVC